MSNDQQSGPALLAAALEREGIRCADLERDLGIPGNGLVTRWLKKQRRPGLELAIKLERRLGIPVESWIDVIEDVEAGAA